MNISIKKPTIRLFALCTFYLIYLFIGAAIFSSIEYSNEQEIIENLKTKRAEFLLKNKPCLNDSDLEAFISRIVAANNRGISAIANLTVEPNWSFGQAVFFSGTVLTTIGYGHVSPLSPAGKVFCIFYALFGIPITLVMISACVERLLLVTNRLYERMRHSRLFSANGASSPLTAAAAAVSSSTNAPHHTPGGPVNYKLLTYSHLALVAIFVLVVFFLIPAAVFSSIENEWNYLDGLYYCFISLSTIGLGDYIPGDKNEQPYRVFYKIATTFYLIIGIMFVMLFISVLTQIPELNLARLFSLEIDSSSDPERQLLAESTNNSTSYTRQIDDDDYQSAIIAPLDKNAHIGQTSGSKY